MKKWLASSEGELPQKVASLGNKIIHDLSSKLVVSGPAIVSSVVLMGRKGISDDALQ